MEMPEITASPIPGGNVAPDPGAAARAESAAEHQGPGDSSANRAVPGRPKHIPGKAVHTNAATVGKPKQPEYGKELSKETLELGRELMKMRGQVDDESNPLNDERGTDQSTLDDGSDETPLGESAPEAGIGDDAGEDGEVAAKDGDQVDDDVIRVPQSEYDSVVFELERDGKKEKVSLGTLVKNQMDRTQFLQHKQRVHESEKRAEQREQAASQVMEQHEFMNDLGLTPREFVLTYAKSQVQAGMLSPKLAEFLALAFDDPEAGYNADAVNQRAYAIRQDKVQRKQIETQEQERRVGVIRSDMEFIAQNFNGGKWLEQKQIDALYGKMQELQNDRGYPFVAPLEAYRIFKDEIMGTKKPPEKPKSREQIINRLRNKKPTVPGAGVSGEPNNGKAPRISTRELGRAAMRELRQGIGA